MLGSKSTGKDFARLQKLFYEVRLQARQKLHALSELFYIVAAISVVHMQSKSTEVCRYFCQSKIRLTFLGSPLPHSRNSKRRLSREVFLT